ncbi:MAG: hypothetical protein ACYC4S_00665 [Rhodoferax sp.]
MIDINTYLAKQYGPQPCWELVSDVYATELQAVPVDYKTVNRSIRQMASEFRLAIHKSPHGFAQVTEPTDLCIVLLAKNAHIGIHHCGIYHNGSVLHAMPGATLFEPLSVINDMFETVQFWAKQ